MGLNSEIWRMDAVSLAEMVRTKALSPIEVVEALLAHMEEVDPRLHAFCTPAPDLARETARRLEQRILAGDKLGRLAGVPVSVKDLVLTAGLTTAMGSIAYRDFVPEEDDVVVERLKAADAVILGKTNVSEFGYSAVGHNPVFETTRNPWNPDLTPGGSSAGAGAAVASGMGPLAIGSDGGGSVRIPASLCGIVGVKASMGRVPLYPGCRDERYPGASSWESLEHIGPLTRTVADAALMLSVIAGPDTRDRHSLPAPEFDWMDCLDGDLRGWRVAYSSDFGYVAVEPEVRAIIGDAAKVFERDLGCRVEEVDPGWDDPYWHFLGLVALDTDLTGMRRLLEEHAQEMTPGLVDFLNRPWTAEELTDAIVARKAFTNHMWRLMRNYDLLLTPTLAVPPFPVHMPGPEKIAGRIVANEHWTSFMLPANLTGQPAVSVPAGWTEDGLPVGLQIIGRHLDDPSVLRAAAAYEAARPWRDRWPPIVDS